MIRFRTILRSIWLRYILIAALLVFAWWSAETIRAWLDFQILANDQQDVRRALVLATLAYVILLALPFVPGAEIGLAMLFAFGPSAAPLIYAATLVSMLLAYGIGRFLPIGALEHVFSALRMRRTAGLIARAAPLSNDERLSMLMESQPPRTIRLALRYRYVAVALAVNTPGNTIIGGGGGIMMMAGLSGFFAPLPTFLTILVAVAPVPVLVFSLGMHV